MPEMTSHLKNSCDNNESVKDFTDGLYLKYHEPFQDRNAIKILVYFDDIEMVNLIGVKVK